MTNPLIVPLSDAALVFGLDWFPLVGRKAASTARRLARRHRATHVLFAGSPPAAVGMAVLEGGPARGPLYSAAQNLAQLHPRGTYAVLLELEGRGCWLAVVHDGVVVSRTDKLYRTRNDAARLLAELTPAFPRLQLLGDAGAPDQPDLALLGGGLAAQSRLMPARRWHPLFPGPVQYFLLALTVAIVGPEVYGLTRPRPAEPPPGSSHMDAAAAWQQSVVASASGRAVHGSAGTRALLEALYVLPVRLGGWKLIKVECRAQSSAWLCDAGFERAHRSASNLTFLEHGDPRWSVDFTATEHARVTWQVAAASRPLTQMRLASTEENDRRLVSDMQAIKPGFAQLHISKSSPLALAAPLGPQGLALPKPSDLTVYQKRGLRTAGPLRSTVMLLPHSSHIGWHKAELTVSPTDRPTLTHSGLTLTLEGAIYEVLDGSPNTATEPPIVLRRTTSAAQAS